MMDSITNQFKDRDKSIFHLLTVTKLRFSAYNYKIHQTIGQIWHFGGFEGCFGYQTIYKYELASTWLWLLAWPPVTPREAVSCRL